ncbi:MAG TPA: aspartate-semialdehyde dehydrogenase [Rectinemataceae bacterium]|nr:aspartate-semialdehyde dehydrogenase [Rectinemataceae bacterium]
MNRIPVTVLGATGVVGQRFVRRLAKHPLFRVASLAASERSVGKKYAEACDWRLPGEAYAGLGDMILEPCEPSRALSQLVFSALDTGPAREIEPLFAAAGALVFSNASAFRMEEDVPLLVPELNAAHLGLLELQRKRRGWKGGIVCNPNCTTTVLVGALGPLHRTFGAEAVMAVSMQALSGAGYPGVASLDAVANVVPLIRGEEEKVESEAQKILGSFDGSRVVPAPFGISAACNRVPVVDGHMIATSIRLRGSPSPAEVEAALEAFVPDTAGLGLRSAPERFVVVRHEVDRPQPRRDVEDDGGMRIQVGRVRLCPILGSKMMVLGHNTERGAAGGSLLNAEMAVARGIL